MIVTTRRVMMVSLGEHIPPSLRPISYASRHSKAVTAESYSCSASRSSTKLTNSWLTSPFEAFGRMASSNALSAGKLFAPLQPCLGCADASSSDLSLSRASRVDYEAPAVLPEPCSLPCLAATAAPNRASARSSELSRLRALACTGSRDS